MGAWGGAGGTHYGGRRLSNTGGHTPTLQDHGVRGRGGTPRGCPRGDCAWPKARMFPRNPKNPGAKRRSRGGGGGGGGGGGCFSSAEPFPVSFRGTFPGGGGGPGKHLFLSFFFSSPPFVFPVFLLLLEEKKRGYLVSGGVLLGRGSQGTPGARTGAFGGGPGGLGRGGIGAWGPRGPLPGGKITGGFRGGAGPALRKGGAEGKVKKAAARGPAKGPRRDPSAFSPGGLMDPRGGQGGGGGGPRAGGARGAPFPGWDLAEVGGVCPSGNPPKNEDSWGANLLFCRNLLSFVEGETGRGGRRGAGPFLPGTGVRTGDSREVWRALAGFFLEKPTPGWGPPILHKFSRNLDGGGKKGKRKHSPWRETETLSGARFGARPPGG